MTYMFMIAAVNAGAGLLSISPFLILIEVLARRQIPLLPLPHLIGSGLFGLSLSTILSVTGIPAVYDIHIYPNINLIPFTNIAADMPHYVESILLFLPVGTLLPLLYRSFQRLSRCVLYGFFFSLAIELAQLLCFRVTDIDDLLMNTLGAAIGFGIFFLFKKLYPPVTHAFSLSEEQIEKLPALFGLEACILTVAAWAAALLLAPAIRNIILTIFL